MRELFTGLNMYIQHVYVLYIHNPLLGHQYILHFLIFKLESLRQRKERGKNILAWTTGCVTAEPMMHGPINTDWQEHIVGQCFPSAHSALFIPNCLACYASAWLLHWQRNQETQCTAPTPSQTLTNAFLAVCVTPSYEKINDQFAIHRPFYWQVQLWCFPVR